MNKFEAPQPCRSLIGTRLGWEVAVGSDRGLPTSSFRSTMQNQLRSAPQQGLAAVGVAAGGPLRAPPPLSRGPLLSALGPRPAQSQACLQQNLALTDPEFIRLPKYGAILGVWQMLPTAEMMDGWEQRPARWVPVCEMNG